MRLKSDLIDEEEDMGRKRGRVKQEREGGSWSGVILTLIPPNNPEFHNNEN
jgi:hypothetical protein